MFLIARLFLFLAKSAEQRDKERDDAYLAEATDIYDLEARMRTLDQRRARPTPAWMTGR